MTDWHEVDRRVVALLYLLGTGNKIRKGEGSIQKVTYCPEMPYEYS